MKKPLLFLIACTFLYCTSAQAKQSTAVRAVVLPFEIFSLSPAKVEGADIARTLAQKLDSHRNIIVPEQSSVKRVLRDDLHSSMSEDQLKTIAGLLDAHFIVFGSLTCLNNSYSMDAQVFNSFAGDRYFKTFAEGGDIEEVVSDVAEKTYQRMMDLAELIPPVRQVTIDIPENRTRKLPGDHSPRKGNTEGEYISFEDELNHVLEGDMLHEPVEESGEGMPGSTVAPPETVPEAQSDDVRVAQYDIEPERDESADEDDLDPEDAEPVEAPPAAHGKKKQRSMSFDGPISINADTLEYDNKNSSATFTGNVVARQGDIVIYAERIKSIYSQSGGLKRLYAVGNVKIVQGDRIATGKKIVFYNASQKIVATGNPRVWQGDNVIQGKKITVFLKDDRYLVEGTPGKRVSATLHPKKKN